MWRAGRIRDKKKKKTLGAYIMRPLDDYFKKLLVKQVKEKLG